MASYNPNRIIRLRDIRHWSQAQLAKKANVPQPRISAFENGIKPRKVEHLEALADALDCTLDFLVGRQYKNAKTDAEIDKAASRMAFKVFADGATDGQRERCRRILGHPRPPLTAHGWKILAEHIDRAVPPTGEDRKLYAVNGND